jgi:Ring finger domain
METDIPPPLLLTTTSVCSCWWALLSERASLYSHFVSSNLQCVSTWSCSSWHVFLTALYCYLVLAVVSNLLACYKFILAWNLIWEARRRDMTPTKLRRRKMIDQRKTHVHAHDHAVVDPYCPVCINDFVPDQVVTCCYEGCKHLFHKECLHEWLERSDSCPCCRSDLLSPSSSNWLCALSAFMGFATR